MSRIEKLSILGVRSFGPQHQETIAFNTPLTLIVGYNGSGKTTIIECLKYATTGELPPNSKGGAFIHDPTLAGEKDVRAQVKVSFRSTVGESYVITRNIQLMVKKNTRSQKTLEGSLLLRNNGERHVISTRVMELDKLAPEKLGVSPAVLDTVIFCHQDESLWPMSEPAALKKRFDEIFEAMKYTKVIDNLKVLRKKKGEELRELKLQEGQDKSNKERADKVNKLMAQLTRDIQEGQDKWDELTGQMKEEEAKIKSKHEQANSFLRIVNDLQTKTEKLEYKKEAVQELRSRIEESSDTDQVLRNTLDEYEQTIERTVSDRDRKASQFHELQGDLKSSREQHTAKASEQGKHQSDKDKYERQLETRDRMIHEAATRHEFRGYDGDLDDRRITAFNERIQKALNDKKRELERLQRDNAEDLDKKSAVITERESRKASLIRDRASAKQRIITVGKESATIQGELSRLDIDEGAEAVLRTEMKELEGRIETARAEEQGADLDTHIKKANDDIWNLEAQSAKLARELVECTRLASERAQLDLRKKQLSERRRELDILKKTWSEPLSALIGEDWQPETIESEFQNALKLQNSVVAERRKQKDATQQELKQVEYKLTNARERQNKLSTERENCKRAVMKALKDVRNPDSPPIEDYTKELESIEAELSQTETDLKLYDEMKKHYASIKDRAVRFNKCYYCERDFKDQQTAKSKLLDKIAKKLTDEDKEELMEDQVHFAEQIKTLKAVRSQYDSYQRLEAELPSITKDIDSASSQREELVRRLEDQDLAFREAEEKQQEVDGLGKNVLKISQAHKDIIEAEKQVERSQQSSSVAMRSPDEINEEQTACAEQTRTAQAKLSKLTSERQRLKDLVGQLEVERLELRNKISTAAQQLERKKNLQESIRKCKEEQLQLRETIQESTIANLESEMKDLTVQINKLNKEIDNSDAKKRNIADNLTYRKNLRECDTLEEEIAELESRNAQEDYDRLTQEARYLETRRSKLTAERERLVGTLTTKDSEFKRLDEEYSIELKDAKAKFKESHIKVETTKAAIDDLGRGTAALDHAIMRFHSLKMEEINRTIGELWQSTYQGTDIDTIQIRSDVEAGAGSGTGKRNYNYRVSMVKGDTEMDMRGRCSAGQKVLASIIIRLALAESFGVNCGLIALDEPTTNLDSDNIRSLAESLHGIIKARRAQSNLQLIVITHDEEFLKHMQCSDFCDDFYRVKRDEKQNSVIVRESITRIME
ncbi:P-loop containing nucleoside triphosphate hydrolase protein [Chaetomium sp. MPI-SDFR-AT-0129]|nr:P-loop containing nucleoside triphosphate hydrolase protein [Chaetomium sp. MPI-SDFR-AT-0129]